MADVTTSTIEGVLSRIVLSRNILEPIAQSTLVVLSYIYTLKYSSSIIGQHQFMYVRIV